MKKTWKMKAGITAAMLCVAGFVFIKWMKKEKAPVFRTAHVERGAIQVTVLATGVVGPQNRLQIKPPIAGRAEEILVHEGQAVNKGQILAWMSSTERAALLDAARAKGPEELAHWEDLYKPTPLIAPLYGVIISRNVEPGQTVTAQDAVLVMSDRLIVKAQVDETDIARVQVKQKAQITLDAYPEEIIPGNVNHIAFEAKTVSNVTMYEVDIAPEKTPSFMRSGMTANVTFLVAEKKDILVVPAEAVREENGRSRVLSPSLSGRKKRPMAKPVETGLSDGKKVEILGGLAEGDAVLVPAMRLPRQTGAQQRNPFAPGGGGGARRRGS